MRNLTTYRINIGRIPFDNSKMAREFLVQTGLSGSVKEKGGHCLLEAGEFRTKVEEEARQMQEKISQFAHLTVKIIEEHNNHRQTAGTR